MFVLAHKAELPAVLLHPPLHTTLHTHSHKHKCWMAVLFWPWLHLELIQPKGCWRCWRARGAARWRTGCTVSTGAALLFYLHPTSFPQHRHQSNVFFLHSLPLHTHTRTHTLLLVTAASCNIACSVHAAILTPETDLDYSVKKSGQQLISIKYETLHIIYIIIWGYNYSHNVKNLT